MPGMVILDAEEPDPRRVEASSDPGVAFAASWALR